MSSFTVKFEDTNTLISSFSLDDQGNKSYDLNEFKNFFNNDFINYSDAILNNQLKIFPIP